MANAEIDMTLGVNVSGGSSVESDSRHADTRKRTLGGKRYFWSSALARRIIAFNLIALCVLLLGMLYLSQFRSNIAAERMAALRIESTLYAQLLQERVTNDNTAATPTDALIAAMSAGLPDISSTEIRIFDAKNTRLISPTINTKSKPEAQTESVISSFFDNWMDTLAAWFSRPVNTAQAKNAGEITQNLAVRVAEGGPQNLIDVTQSDKMVVAAGQPIMLNGALIGSVIASTPEGLMDVLRRQERNNILRMFALAAGLSIILSLVLANTIANPIHDLAAAMDAGNMTKLRKDDPNRVRIPDMAGRDDEIGHLSSAMQNMTSALYHRIVPISILEITPATRQQILHPMELRQLQHLLPEYFRPR